MVAVLVIFVDIDANAFVCVCVLVYGRQDELITDSDAGLNVFFGGYEKFVQYEWFCDF